MVRRFEFRSIRRYCTPLCFHYSTQQVADLGTFLVTGDASSGAFSARPDQHFRRDAEALMQTPDHADGQATLAVKNLRYAGPRADDLLKIPAREPLLLHAELDRL